MNLKQTYVLLSLTTALVATAACSTLVTPKEELRASPTCQVWQDGLVGNRNVTEVKDELAQQKVTCWIMNMYACTYTDYTFRPGTSEILSSLPPKDKAVGHVDGDTLHVDMKGLDVDPIELKKGFADYSYKGPIGPRQSKHVEFNDMCTKRQASLGILTLIGH